ncbi:MAG: DUF4142 domain-containing protein [Verrucomicrobia bacterium]|nr:DUF4142 domain-containing protein [Verrucomicrobiota bacterium]
MKKSLTLISLLLPALLLVGALGWQPVAQAESAGGLTAQEKAFVKEAGGGNAAEVQLAQLALKNSQNSDVKDFAQMMIKDHSQANTDLGKIAEQHKITPFPPEVPAKEKAFYDKVVKMTGADFDKAYVDHAVEDHTKDAAAYKKAQGEVKDPMLKQYVDKVTPIVEHHLEMAKADQAKMRKG